MAGAALPDAAHAAILTFSDRTLFTAAAAGPLTTETFDSFVVDTEFRTSAVDVGPFSLLATGLSSTAPVSPENNSIDAAPAVAAEADVNGTSYARLFTRPGGSILLTLDSAATAFGADFRNINDGAVRTALFVDGEQVDVPIGNGNRFFGFTSTSAFTTIEFRGIAIGDVFGIDNVSINGVTAVPEPGAWAMMIAGFGLVGGAMRRRQQRPPAALAR